VTLSTSKFCCIYQIIIFFSWNVLYLVIKSEKNSAALFCYIVWVINFFSFIRIWPELICKDIMHCFAGSSIFILFCLLVSLLGNNNRREMIWMINEGVVMGRIWWPNDMNQQLIETYNYPFVLFFFYKFRSSLKHSSCNDRDRENEGLRF
jgi:hypothetical protein